VNRLSRHDLNLLLVSAIWGANYSVSKLAVDRTSPIVFAAVRYLVSTALLWLLVRWTVRADRIDRRRFWIILAWGVVGHTLNQTALLYGLRQTSPTNAALIFTSLPVIVALLGILLGLERASPKVWLGIALGTIGVALVVTSKGTRFEAGSRLGDLLLVASVLCWAGFTLGLREAARGVNPAQVTAITFLGGTPGLVLAALPVALADRPRLDGTVWAAVAYASILGSVVASVLWTRSLAALGGNRTALYSCVQPIFAALAAWLILHERPVAVQGVGAALVIAGVLVSSRRTKGEGG
jgi:drug/metabolite transporter (DMT)-like permease